MNNTKNGLTLKVRTKVIAILNDTLANLSDLYSQTKQAHWSVRGKFFIAQHKLFDELADTVEEHIDPTAERITALGGIAKGTVRQAAANSALPEFPTAQADDLAFINVLIDRFSKTANLVRKAIDDIADLGDTGSADLLTGMNRDLDQALWFLEAHLRA